MRESCIPNSQGRIFILTVSYLIAVKYSRSVRKLMASVTSGALRTFVLFISKKLIQFLECS